MTTETQPDAHTQQLAQALANTMGIPVSIVAQNGRYLIQDDADLACYGGRANIVATFVPDDDVPTDNPDVDSTPGTYGPNPPRAVTAQSIAIEAKLTVCGYCEDIHHIQACPTLRQALHAEVWQGADLGRGLCQMRWRNHAGFVALLSEATPARLVEYAQSYLLFLASTSSTNLTVHEVLTSWTRELRGERALQVAA